MKWLVIISFLTLACTEFDTYYNLDDYDLDFDFETETVEVKVSKYMTRYVKTSSKGISLHLEEDSSKYMGEFSDADEPYPAWCGPTALKNLLFWYDTYMSYYDAGKTLKTSSDASDPEIWFVCAAACGADVVICTNICYDLFKDMVQDGQGTTTKHAFAAIKKLTPEGYEFHSTSDDPSMIVELIDQLWEGNPVFINEYVGGLHMAVLTGIHIDKEGVPHVRMANSAYRTLEQFMEGWSLKGFGDDKKRRRVKRLFGIKPFMAAWYSKKD